MRHVVHFSTGAGSAEVAWRVVAQHGAKDVVLLTADTMVEDEDNWRFANQVSHALGVPITRVADGRTPMEVGRDHRVVPNNRMAVCSRVLKRELLSAYMNEHFTPEDSIHYIGFDWTEVPRLDTARPHWAPWRIEAPLAQPPYIDKDDILDLFRARGIKPPRLYEQGFTHANCGGACVRGGQAQWELLLRVNRSRYLAWEAEEEQTRAMLGKDVSILRDRTDGQTVPLTLGRFRERLDRQPALFDTDDWGACGCTEDFVRIGDPA